MCKKVNRWYWKCRDCLGVGAVNESLPNGCRCGACGGEMWCMGQVMGTSRIGHTETRCACDARCTAAPGPNCDCRCGGENHGTGAVVQVDVVTGSVPVARCADSNKLRASLPAVGSTGGRSKSIVVQPFELIATNSQ